MEYHHNIQADFKGFELAEEKLKETLDYVESKKHILLNQRVC